MGISVFSLMLDERPEVLALGGRSHAMLATASMDAVAACLQRDRWCCRECGTMLPGYMEVTHLGEHEPCSAEGMKAVCQFCHNLLHPVWAALRGRLRVVFAPGLSSETINRLAWQTLLASPGADGEPACPEHEQAALQLVRDIDGREATAAVLLGSADPQCVAEAIFSARHLAGEDFVREKVDRLDRYFKLWPVAAERVARSIDRPSAAVSCWHDGRFVDVSADLITAWRRAARGHPLSSAGGSESLRSDRTGRQTLRTDSLE